MLQHQTLLVHRSHDVEGTGHILCDIDPLYLGGQHQSQIMFFLVNAYPKPFDVATSNFVGA